MGDGSAPFRLWMNVWNENIFVRTPRPMRPASRTCPLRGSQRALRGGRGDTSG
jgi:hypothetical protein